MVVWKLNKVIEKLRDLPFSEREISNMASWLWEEGMGFSQYQQKDLTIEEDSRIQNFISRALNGEPAQYIVGHAYFFGLKLKVTPAVLIPRPETEELVEWIIGDANGENQVIRILDIGTGSGCIPIALKNYYKKNAEVTSIDVSDAALDVAFDNCVRHKANVTLIHRDFLNEGIDDLGKFKVIVSNPPYISKAEVTGEMLKGIAHEPGEALYPEGDDPDIFYRKMSTHIHLHLEVGGALYVEINQFRHIEIDQIFREEGWETEIRKDMQGSPRMMKLIYPSMQRKH